MTKHCITATAIGVLNSLSVEGRHIITLTGHKNVENLKPYCDRPTFRQFRGMSHMFRSLVDGKRLCKSSASSAFSGSAILVPTTPQVFRAPQFPLPSQLSCFWIQRFPVAGACLDRWSHI